MKSQSFVMGREKAQIFLSTNENKTVQVECKNGVFTWETMNTEMTRAKFSFVAFQVPEEFVK